MSTRDQGTTFAIIIVTIFMLTEEYVEECRILFLLYKRKYTTSSPAEAVPLSKFVERFFCELGIFFFTLA